MNKTLTIFVAILSLAIISTALSALPQSEEFTISRSTLDGGGGSSAGGEFTLSGSIGQPDADSNNLAGGSFLAAGGFWARVTDLIFSNSFENP